MDSSPPQPIGPGQRLLAAIVFTDVVSFSARMQAEEVTTLSLLEGDFAVMREACQKYSGSVLKTTGDGLLLYFTSAVNAVSCALQLQRFFAERVRSDPGEQHLVHRVGIHLGDVFVNDNDVMGDGVNIAARLQAQADPGGLCISQTVYEVVKNKLKLTAVKLEPRELKNISEAVTMYRILLAPPKARLQAPRATFSPAVAPAARGATGVSFSRTHKLFVFAGLVGALGVVAWLLVGAYRRNQVELAQSEAARAKLGALVAQKTENPPVPPPGTISPTQAPAEPASYDFAALLLNPPKSEGGAGPEVGAARRRAAQLIPVVVAWINADLQRYTLDNPLLVHAPGGSASGDLQVFTDTAHRLSFAEGGAIRPRQWTELQPDVQGAIVASALLDSPTPPARDVLQSADAFAYFYHLPDVAEALHPGKK